MVNERNNWDRSNQQGQNMDPDNSEDQFLKDDVENPNKEADGHGSEAGRSDHSDHDSGLGSRSGSNKNDNKLTSSRSNESLSSGNEGGGGRSHGN